MALFLNVAYLFLDKKKKKKKKKTNTNFFGLGLLNKDEFGDSSSRNNINIHSPLSVLSDFKFRNSLKRTNLRKFEKFEKLIGINDFSFQFRKIITRYRRIGYNLNVMRQSACLVFNPVMVDNYAAFLNCTPVGRASDSMIAPT